MKKHLSILLSALLLISSSFTASAFEAETVEAADEKTAVPAVEAQAFEETSLDIPLIDAQKGKLIFYQNFDAEGATFATVDYFDAAYITPGSITGSSTTLTLETDPADASNKVLKMTNAGSSWHQYVVNVNMPLKEGEYTVAYRHASENGDVVGYMQRFFTSPQPVLSDGSSKDDAISINPDGTNLNANPKTLYDTSYTGVCKTIDGIKKFGMKGGNMFPMAGDVPMNSVYQLRLIPNKGNLYVDDFRIYFFPENAFTVADGVDIKFIEPTTATYTFPKTDGVYFYVNKTNPSETYKPGQTVDTAALAGGKFVGIHVPQYVAEKGELVLYMDYETGDLKTLTYVNPVYSNITAFSGYRTDGTDLLKLVADPTDETGKNHAMKVYSNNTSAHRLAVPQFADISLANSAFTSTSRYMLVSPADFSHIYFRFQKPGAGDVSATKLISIKDNPPAELTWTNLSVTPNDMSGLDNGINSFGYQINMIQGKETTYYIDDYALYAYPLNSVMFTRTKGDADVTMLRNENLHGADLSFTFPTMEDLGYTLAEGEYFFAWASYDGKQHYQPGETVKYANLNHQTFYPFIQSVNDNAMGYVFDGDVNMTGYDNQSLSFKETVNDEGRSVLHLRTYKSFNSALLGGRWATDSRIGMRTSEDKAFSGTEFPIVTYTYKIENTYKVPDAYLNDKNYDPALEEFADEQPEPLSESLFVFWYYKKNANGKIWIANNGENKLGDAYQKATIDGKYHTLTLNMRSLASNARDPYNSGDVYGFALDPVASASWSSDVYVDSIRAYRFGYTTVTYATNAPAGATVVSEVAADTDRGIGKGYLLTDTHPVLEGYTFAGWALSPDATADDVIDTIDLTGDTTVYAVWESAAKTAKPEMASVSSVYLSEDTAKNGIRFRAAVSAATLANEKVREYGFLVARQDKLDKYLDSLDHSFYSPENSETLKPLYVEGKAFERNAEGVVTKNIIYNMTPDGDVTFVARCVGLNLASKAHVTAELTARPYLRYAGANGSIVTLYGNTYTSSLYGVVKSIKDKADAGDAEALEDYNAHKSYYDAILAIAESTEG